MTQSSIFGHVKKSFSIFFVFYFILGGLFPQVDFGQLAHIPDAMAHYQEHWEEAQLIGVDFSLSSFLRDHYSDPDGHEHDDQNSHDQLPLQHIHQTIHLVHLGAQELFLDAVDLTLSSEIAFHHELCSEDFRVGIDHPPARFM